jgi:hypothetical protein
LVGFTAEDVEKTMPRTRGRRQCNNQRSRTGAEALVRRRRRFSVPIAIMRRDIGAGRKTVKQGADPGIELCLPQVHIMAMQPIRTSVKWLRLGLAVLFAAVTVVQVPAMAIACATGSAQPVAIAVSHDSHHHSHSAHRHPTEPASDATQDASTCYALGCCAALHPLGVTAPAATDVLLGGLDLALARAMLPSLREPADPPPRLQV